MDVASGSLAVLADRRLVGADLAGKRALPLRVESALRRRSSIEIAVEQVQQSLMSREAAFFAEER